MGPLGTIGAEFPVTRIRRRWPRPLSRKTQDRGSPVKNQPHPCVLRSVKESETISPRLRSRLDAKHFPPPAVERAAMHSKVTMDPPRVESRALPERNGNLSASRRDCVLALCGETRTMRRDRDREIRLRRKKPEVRAHPGGRCCLTGGNPCPFAARSGAPRRRRTPRPACRRA